VRILHWRRYRSHRLDSARALLLAAICNPVGKVRPSVSISLLARCPRGCQAKQQGYIVIIALSAIRWTMDLGVLCSRWSILGAERRRRLLIGMASEAADIRKKALLVKIKVQKCQLTSDVATFVPISSSYSYRTFLSLLDAGTHIVTSFALSFS